MKSKPVSISLTDDEKRRAVALSKSEHLTLSAFIRKLIRDAQTAAK